MRAKGQRRPWSNARRRLRNGPAPRSGARLAPAPPGLPLLGHAHALARDKLGTFLRWHRQLGDVVRIRVVNVDLHLLYHPDGARHVLQTHARVYTKQARSLRKLSLVIGQGLLVSDGSFWRRQRRIAQPAFHRRRIEACAGRMVRAAEELSDRWRARPQDESVEVSWEMTRITLRLVSETLLGSDISAEGDRLGTALSFLLEDVERRLNPLALPLGVPTPRNLRFRTELAALDRIAYRIIAERRQAGTQRDDLLQMLVEARDEETGEAMSDEQLRDELMTFFLAGHDTTAHALSWTWYLLARHPSVARRMHAELDEVLDGRSPTLEDLPRLVYTKMVLQESMRLYPPAWALSRSPSEDDEIAGFHIPAGSQVLLMPWVTHRHPDFWHEPEAFDPERFAPERAAAIPRFAYFPFGAGPRQCIGTGFAMLEAHLVLATLSRDWQLDLVPGHPVEPEPAITLRPRHGLRVTLRPRR